MDVKYALKGQNKQYYSGLMPLSRSERLLKSSTMVNNIIDRMTKIVATANIVGLICSRIPENICLGIVLCLTSANCRTTTTSSKDVINANNAPDMTPGRITGV